MTPEELEGRVEALEASNAALWRVIQVMAEPEPQPTLESAHRASLARLKARQEGL